MPIQYHIDVTTDIIEETWSGTVTMGDLRDYWSRYLADAEVLRRRRTMVDLRDANIAFTGADLESLIRTLVLPILGDREWRTAIVVLLPVQFGVARQYQAFAHVDSHDEIFDDPDKAKAWLRAIP